MAKTYQQIADDWITYMIATDKIQDRDDIPPHYMERIIVAAKRLERFYLLYELNQTITEDEEE